MISEWPCDTEAWSSAQISFASQEYIIILNIFSCKK